MNSTDAIGRAGGETAPETAGRHVDTLVEAVAAAGERLEIPFAETAGGSPAHMVWRVWGQGPDLLLLHGNAGSWLHFIRNIDTLARSHRVIVPDLPGCGESDDIEGARDADGLAQAVLSALPHVRRGGRLDILGFSMGGSVALSLAATLRQEVSRLILLGCGRGFGLPSPEAPALMRWKSIEDPEERFAAHAENLRRLMLTPNAAYDPLAHRIHAGAVEACRLRYTRSGYEESRRKLSQVSARLAGIWGERDVLMGPFASNRAEFLLSHSPEAETLFVEGAGHWVQYERADRVNAILTRLLGAES